jgi:hypothetical protein
VLDDFFGDPAGVASHPSRVERNGAEQALWGCPHRLDTDGGAIGGMAHAGLSSRRWIGLAGHAGGGRLRPRLVLCQLSLATAGCTGTLSPSRVTLPICPVRRPR